MSTSYYYTGTDYSTLHPFHWDFWYHLFIPWNYHNWIWLVLIIIYYWVKFNEAHCYKGPGFLNELDR